MRVWGTAKAFVAIAAVLVAWHVSIPGSAYAQTCGVYSFHRYRVGAWPCCKFLHRLLEHCPDDGYRPQSCWESAWQYCNFSEPVDCYTVTDGHCTEPPPTCDEGCSEEVCNGVDDDGNGSVDDGVCGSDDAPCAAYRGDPVHVGRGTYIGHPIVDVEITAPVMPIVFRRQYTSADRWGGMNALCTQFGCGGASSDVCCGESYVIWPDPNRLSEGWFHTFDERLIHANGLYDELAGGEDEVIHRDSTGRGRRFVCDPPNADGDRTCTSPDWRGSLEWIEYSQRWSLTSDDGVAAVFQADGFLEEKRRAGGGWQVRYQSIGSKTDRLIDYVEHVVTHQRLVFVWDTSVTVPQLQRLETASGVVLASFEYASERKLLTGADSAAGDYDYQYVTYGTSDQTDLLQTILQDGVAVLENTYSGRRVRTTRNADGAYEFYYGDEAGNTCPSGPQHEYSTTVIDLSTGNETCQQYATGNFGSLLSVSGYCPCGGAQSFTWNDNGSTEPDTIATAVSRDGVTTSLAYDSERRLVASCRGDDDTTVTTDPSSCPSQAHWVRYTYGDSAWPDRVTEVAERSRVMANQFFTTTFVYDSANGNLLSRTKSGWSQSLDGTPVARVESESWAYDIAGRMTAHCVGDDDSDATTCPAGSSLTTYEYYESPGGFEHGLLWKVHERVSATAALTTTYLAYNEAGRPTEIQSPSSAIAYLAYDASGTHVISRTIGTQVTTYTYYPGGRLKSIIEPKGRTTTFEYGAYGRLRYERVWDDSTETGIHERTEYVYDDAGRITYVAVKHLNESEAVVIGTPTELAATYDDFGYQESLTVGPNLPETYTYDPNGMGRLEQLVRGDGGTEQFEHVDPFGRETSYQRYFSRTSSGIYAMSYAQPSGAATEDPRPTSIVDPRGPTRSYTYDDFGDLVRAEASDFGIQSWEYDRGRVTATEHPSGKISTYTYDDLGRPLVVDHDSANPSVVGQDYRYHYDNGDGAEPCSVAGATPCVWRVGELARVEIEYAPGAFWDFLYDYTEDGRVQAEVWPGGYQTTYEYDTDGRLVRIETPAGTGDAVRYDYDTDPGDGEDPFEISAVVAEYPSGYTYFHYARDIERDQDGRITIARLADNASGSFQSVTNQYRSDGNLEFMQVQRDYAGSPVLVTQRGLEYFADGMVRAWHDWDDQRGFFYDDANRLTCATYDPTDTVCPAGPPNLVTSYAWDEAGNPFEKVDSSGGSTGYYIIGNALYDEYPPGGRTIWYDYSYWTNGYLGGPRVWDEEVTSGVDPNLRWYLYDGQERLRTIQVSRPTVHGAYEDHDITILYDHRGRPMYITDLTVATGQERRVQLFWDTENRLINRITTPDAASPWEAIIDIYARVDDRIVGSVRLDYTGAGTFERWLYDVRDPVGLPIARYEHGVSGNSAPVWTGGWSPFGELIKQWGETDLEPPWRFHGQLVLDGSDASVWTPNQTTDELRDRLNLNHWRVYDPRVGQYLTAEPLATIGGQPHTHPYGYAAHSPLNFVDLDGLQTTCNPNGPMRPECIGRGEYGARTSRGLDPARSSGRSSGGGSSGGSGGSGGSGSGGSSGGSGGSGGSGSGGSGGGSGTGGGGTGASGGVAG